MTTVIRLISLTQFYKGLFLELINNKENVSGHDPSGNVKCFSIFSHHQPSRHHVGTQYPNSSFVFQELIEIKIAAIANESKVKLF